MIIIIIEKKKKEKKSFELASEIPDKDKVFCKLFTP